MSGGHLRSYMPVVAPHRREPADGTERPLRVNLGFEPRWYTARMGVDFSERWHRDPVFRGRELDRIKADLASRFPSVPHWESANPSGTISGVYGIYVVAHALGLEIRYARDAWPELVHGGELSREDLEGLTPKQALESEAMEELFRQMDIIEREWGPVAGYPNWQGVLNVAFHLRGQNVFLDMFDAPELAHALFSLITDVLLLLSQTVQERQRKSGFPVNHFVVSNCVMNMISPEQYAEFLRPCDRRISESFERFGVHTCEWNVTPYLEVLSALPGLGYLDMGMMSDLPAVREKFPDTRLAVLYSPVRLHELSLEEIGEDIRRIARALGPFDLVMASIQTATPDQRIRDFLALCERIESEEYHHVTGGPS